MTDVFEPVVPVDTKDYADASRAQANAADPEHSAWISANAGSGKTKVLIDRVARLLLRREDGRPGAAPDSILCITYTKAAASEMLSRLFGTLGEWSVLEDADLRQKLSALEGRAAGVYTGDDLRAARALFARALETPGGLRIETIHAFCARVLRRFPLEAQVFPGFTEIEEDEADALWEAARREAILQAAETQPDALDVLAREGGHEGALAGLDALRYRASRVLAFAREHEGASAIQAAVTGALNAPEARPDEIIETAMADGFPGPALRSLVAALAEGGKTDVTTSDALQAVFAAETAAAQWAHYLRIFTTAAGAWRKSNPYTAAVAKADPAVAELLQMKDGEGTEAARVRAIADEINLAQACQRTSALLSVGVPAVQRYRALKESRAALDFDDLIEKTRDLLTKDGMSDWVLYKLDGGLSHVLLDEAQDTSPDQWTLIKALTAEFISGKGTERSQDPRTQFVVGDGKQSIYSFQGADPAMFFSEGQDFLATVTDAASDPMEMSFRSSPEVLTFVDEVWNNAPPIDVPGAAAVPASADIVRHTARREGQPGCVELWPIAEKAEEVDEDAWARPVDAQSNVSPKARLAIETATNLKAMIERGETVWAREGESWSRRPMSAQDVLILVRNRTGGLFDAMIGALKTVGLPVAGADRLILADHIGVQDCLNLMRFVLLPSDDLTVAEILRGPFCGLIDDDRYLYALAEGRARGETVWSRVQASEDVDVQAAAAFLKGLQARADLPPYEFLSAVLDRVGPSGLTGWQQINARLGTPARDPIDALLSRAIGHDARTPASMQGFVNEMETDDSEIKRDLAAPGGEVRVMTVHGAKGLQAPVVVLPDTTAKPRGGSESLFDIEGTPIWANSKSVDTPQTEAARLAADARALEENRRLLYVALTRAQDRIIIGGAWYGGGKIGYHADSWYALCASAMDALSEDDAPGEGEPRRYGDVPPCAETKTESADAADSLPDWIYAPAPKPKTPTRVLSAPTGLIARKTPVLAPFGTKRAARMKRGQLIHALLEYLPEVPEADRAARGMAFLKRDEDVSAEAAADMLEAAMGVLNDADLSHLFQAGGRAEAAVIGTARELPEGMLINGRVDRLVVTDDEVLIVDFKTDQPPPDTEDEVSDTYIEQMGAYWAVLSEAYASRKVTAALCWTDGPKLMALSEKRMLDVLKTVKRDF
jgi:ATP-dependent helicase/nuclease subunit A